MSVEEDIQIAKEVIMSDKRESILFNDRSYIYKCTNENMNDPKYIELLSCNKNTFSVVGSGDHILNTVLFDSYDIDAFDISRFPKYFLEFKIAAILTLSYEEYLRFFYENRTFNRKLFIKILNNMRNPYGLFWEGITSLKRFPLRKEEYKPNDIYHSLLFGTTNKLKETAIFNNPYLTKENYYLLRFKLARAKIRYYTGDIADLYKEIDKSFDFANLSNICMYTAEYVNSLNRIKMTKSFKDIIKGIRLNPNGKVLNYLVKYDDGTSTPGLYYKTVYGNEEGFEISEVETETSSKDALLIYRKTK